jgi:hypothetical protein
MKQFILVDITTNVISKVTECDTVKYGRNFRHVYVGAEVASATERCLKQYSDVKCIDGDIVYGEPLPLVDNIKSEALQEVADLTDKWLDALYIPMIKQVFHVNSSNIGMLNSAILLSRDFTYCYGNRVYTVSRSDTRACLAYMLDERDCIILARVESCKCIQEAHNIEDFNAVLDSLKERFKRHGY